MALLRIAAARPPEDFRVELRLTNEQIVERDLRPLLGGPVFEPVRADEQQFRSLRVEDATLVWSNGADLCPDVLIWGGLPPRDPLARAPALL